MADVSKKIRFEHFSSSNTVLSTNTYFKRKMKLKKEIKKTVKKVFEKKICPDCDFNKFVPPGHMYSPIPSNSNLTISENVRHDVFEGLDFNVQKQLDLLDKLSKYADLIPDFPDNKTENFRYYYNNLYFSYPDVSILTCLLLHYKTKKIIDIGGGLSSALILDLNDTVFKENPIHITIIKPEEFRENNNIDDPYLTIIKKNIQDVDRSIFKNLEENDLIFLDTTHSIKLGSEINYIAFHLLPILKKNVKVHIHDIFYPFEYPKQFFHQGKYWNEIYFWKAFLMYNSAFDIELFNSYFEKNHRSFICENFPKYFKNSSGDIAIQEMGSSLWINRK